MRIIQVLLLCVALSAHVLGRCRKWTKPCNGCCCNRTRSQADCSYPHRKWTYVPRLPEYVTDLLFCHQHLPNVTKNTFKNVSTLRLSMLDLTDNAIQDISYDAFSGLQYLEVLKLNSNTKLSHIKLRDALGSIRKRIETLFLENIKIQETTEVFQKLINSSVQKISLSNNRIKFLHFKPFEKMEKLRHLDVSRNNLQNMQSGNFSLKSLTYLNLQNNEIPITTPIFCPHSFGNILFPNLLRLNLAGNFIAELPPKNWNCLDNLTSLSLRENVIRKLEGNSFSGLKNLKQLQLSKLIGTMEKIHSDAFASKSLRELQFQENNIHFKRIKNTKDLFKKCTGLTSLDLSNNDFVNVNDTVIVDMLSPLTNLENLKLVGMRLISIPRNLLQFFPNISTLNIDGNGIQTFDLQNFQNTTTLQYLSCQGNNLRIVKPSSFPKTFLQSLRNLNLADNPFECTCDLLPFKQWIGNHGKIWKFNITLKNWPYRYVCMSPPPMNKRLLRDFHPTVESCSHSDPMLIAYVTIGSFLAVTIVSTTLIYRNIWYIRFWIYKIKRTRSTQISTQEEQTPLLANDLLRYDAYIIYNDDDAAFVHSDLRLFLEEKHQYRLHIWHRDSECGSKIEVMADAIYASNNVIAIVSNNFFNDRWCNFQVDIALDRQVYLGRPYVLLMLMEDLNYESLNSHWCVMLTRLKTAIWCCEENNIKRTVLEEQIKEHLHRHRD